MKNCRAGVWLSDTTVQKNALCFICPYLEHTFEFGSVFFGKTRLGALWVDYCSRDLTAFTAQPLLPWVAASEFGLFLELVALFCLLSSLVSFSAFLE